MIIGGLALVVVLGMIIFFAVRQAGAGRPITDDPVPSSTVSGWDDSRPTATPTATPTPSSSPSPSGSGTAESTIACPTGNPRERGPRPPDGRVHGGGLSFPRIDGWVDDMQTSGVSWGYDVESQGFSVYPGWAAFLGVGEIRAADGFAPSPKAAAQKVMQCVASSGWYATEQSAKDLKAERATIDGHEAWWIRTDIHVTDRKVPGDTVDVIVVDTGRPDAYGLFIGAVAIGDAGLQTLRDNAVRDLTVD